jgi:TnpA family transposase
MLIDELATEFLDGNQNNFLPNTRRAYGYDLRQFARAFPEAKALDAARMIELQPAKRYALACSLLAVQVARAHDDMAEIFIKRMASMHKKGKEALAEYLKNHQKRMDEMIEVLHDVLEVQRDKENRANRQQEIDAILDPQSDELWKDCVAHLTYANDNYYPFLWDYYKTHRPTLFGIIKTVQLRTTSQEAALEQAVKFIVEHEETRADWLPPYHEEGRGSKKERTPLLDLSWVTPKWWGLICETKRGVYPERIDRRHFEVCLFSQIADELKSGDLYIEGADKYSDYREQLVPWVEYKAKLPKLCEMLDLPTDPAEIVKKFKAELEKQCRATDVSFPSNQSVRIEKGEPIITPIRRKQPNASLKRLKAKLAGRTQPVNVLDILTDTDNLLLWHQVFGPLSGHDAKIEDAQGKYLAMVFGYGSNLGPEETIKHFRGGLEADLGYLNQRHSTGDRIERAITTVINGYSRFQLPKYWGTGKRASADGTKWDLYEQNLLSENHIRYGGYGGIGYYHVSDTYIALFSRFIPCGVWEAVYVLDGLLENQSEIQPDTIHGDTQAQNAPVFGLARILGINLMPRIRNWKDLKLFRPSADAKYKHIDDLFTDKDKLDWNLIETHMHDMLRVAMSIKEGRLTASAILKKLGNYSHKNRLYQAFRELGLVVRTRFLMQYLESEELRETIQRSTNKSESFNGFAKWLAFGNNGVVRENRRDEQDKWLKYNHLLANCVIFYNVNEITRILHELAQEGYVIEEDDLTFLSPYMRDHIERMGKFDIDLTRRPRPVTYEIPNVKPSSIRRRAN